MFPLPKSKKTIAPESVDMAQEPPKPPFKVVANETGGYHVYTTAMAPFFGVYPTKVTERPLPTTHQAEQFIADLRARQEEADKANARLARRESERLENERA